MGVRSVFLGYKVLATVVGLSIITLVLVGVPLKYVHDLFPSVLPEGTTGQRIGADINLYLGTAHGFIYMAFVLLALMLALSCRWSFTFTIVTLICGTIPFLSFWAERRAIRRVEREQPEIAGRAHHPAAGAEARRS